MPFLTPLFTLIGTAVSGFFNLRTEQSKVLSDSLSVINNINASDKDRAIAFAQYMQAEANSSHWLASNIRPMIALLLLVLVVAWFFGFAPPNLEKAMPPFIEKAVDALMVFIGFYVPARSFEKITNSILNSRIANEYLKKYL